MKKNFIIMLLFNNSCWNSLVENFYKNLIIKQIEFWYVRGLTNKAQAPK